jgi:hypothetical protein
MGDRHEEKGRYNDTAGERKRTQYTFHLFGEIRGLALYHIWGVKDNDER